MEREKELGERAEKMISVHHTQEVLQVKVRVGEEEKKKLEAEVDALRTQLVEAGNKEQEAGDVEMGGIDSPSQKIMINAATNTEPKTYAQAAAQTHTEVRKEKEKGKAEDKGKGRGPNTPVVTLEVSEVSGGAAGPLQRFPFVEDLSEYEEEGEKKTGTMAKAVVVHGGTHQLADKWGSRLRGKDHGGGYWSEVAPQDRKSTRLNSSHVD